MNFSRDDNPYKALKVGKHRRKKVTLEIHPHGANAYDLADNQKPKEIKAALDKFMFNINVRSKIEYEFVRVIKTDWLGKNEVAIVMEVLVNDVPTLYAALENAWDVEEEGAYGWPEWEVEDI